jgi:hypothetical protein
MGICRHDQTKPPRNLLATRIPTCTLYARTITFQSFAISLTKSIALPMLDETEITSLATG